MRLPTLKELSKLYSEMSLEDFNELDPSDLTEEARTVYYEEQSRRNSLEWKTEQAKTDEVLNQEVIKEKFIVLPQNQFWIMVIIGSLIPYVILDNLVNFPQPFIALGCAIGISICIILFACLVAIVPAGIYWLFKRERMESLTPLIWIFWLLQWLNLCVGIGKKLLE